MSNMTQPQGSVSTYTNIQSIARVLNISSTLVSYLSTDIAINDYTAVYDQSTEKSLDGWFSNGKTNILVY